MSQNNNIYDTANQLERELRESEAFQSLKAQFDAMKNDEEAYELFKQFQTAQANAQQQAMLGQEISAEDQEKMSQLAQEMGNNELIQKLMVEEQKVSNLINDLNRIITEPLTDLYY